jgi:hypothetical protein
MMIAGVYLIVAVRNFNRQSVRNGQLRKLWCRGKTAPTSGSGGQFLRGRILAGLSRSADFHGWTKS